MGIVCKQLRQDVAP